MSFTQLLGPLTCSPVATNCQAHWERIQGVLGLGGATDAGMADAGVAVEEEAAAEAEAEAIARVLEWTRWRC